MSQRVEQNVAHKKKPRIRNRPKNKANRLLETDNEELADDKREQETPDRTTCTPVMNQPNDDNVATSTSQQTSDAIKLIQQLLRDKLLNKTKESGLSDVKATKKATQGLVKKSKSKEKLVPPTQGAAVEKNSFISNLQKKMENAILTNGNAAMPTTLLENLEKLLSQDPISDVESSDDEGEYIEYMYKPRQYFVVSLCNLCKSDLSQGQFLPCARCGLTYYCSKEHMKTDQQHLQLCCALKQVANNSGTDIFYKCADFSHEQFRSYRIVTIRRVEAEMNRKLTATEQEVLLFPRICNNAKCREHRVNRLTDCPQCGQVAFCTAKPEHLSTAHKFWCPAFQLFKEMIMFQAKFGHIDPSLPTKVLRDVPIDCNNTKQVFYKLGFNMKDGCEYAALSQISTGPLTAWYALKLCNQLKDHEVLTVHLIGAEIEFEVDVLQKWELFLLHITPFIKELNVIFVGPELNPRNISFDQLRKIKCCRICRKSGRNVNYYFENDLYHNYCDSQNFMKPNLICFFNAGLYRSTGYALEDTWPETILAAASTKCPVVVTSYTKYESPLDMTRFIQESNRRLNVVLPPTINPFASDKPERNFISDEEAPLMFKNYYCFVIE